MHHHTRAAMLALCLGVGVLLTPQPAGAQTISFVIDGAHSTGPIEPLAGRYAASWDGIIFVDPNTPISGLYIQSGPLAGTPQDYIFAGAAPIRSYIVGPEPAFDPSSSALTFVLDFGPTTQNFEFRPVDPDGTSNNSGDQHVTLRFLGASVAAPEPGTFALGLVGLMGLTLTRRKH